MTELRMSRSYYRNLAKRRRLDARFSTAISRSIAGKLKVLQPVEPPPQPLTRAELIRRSGYAARLCAWADENPDKGDRWAK